MNFIQIKFVHCLIPLLALSLTIIGSIGAPQAEGDDRIRTTQGLKTGEIKVMTPLKIVYEKRGEKRTVEVPNIRSIVFSDEPSELAQARLNANSGAYQNALDSLAKIKISNVPRVYVKQDIEFFRAYCAAKLAIEGTGTINESGKQLGLFLRNNRQSYHYLRGIELLGDLLVASGNYNAAAKQYSKLSQAPWPKYKMKAALLTGNSLSLQEKYVEAKTQFETVLSLAGGKAEFANEALLGTLGKAVCMASSGQNEQAIRSIEKVIAEAEPEDRNLHARAYNALGLCHEKAGRSKEALLAFLHTTELYNSDPSTLAEALGHIVPLWQSIGQDGQARQARQILQDRFPGSRWAR